MEYTGMKNVLKEFFKRIIKDDSTTTKNTWSASKINSEINNYVPKNVESIIGKVKLNGTTIEIECPLLTTGSANMQFFLSTDYQFSLDRKTNYTVKINGNIISTFTNIYANDILCNSSQTSTGTYTFYKGKLISGFISSDVKKLYLRCDGYIQNASYAGNTARTTQKFDRFIAYSTTAAGTAAKVASCDNYALRTGDVFVLIITTSNTASSALTLNVNNRGAKTIYINGTVSSSTNKTLNAGTYFVYYNGTNYYLRTDGKFPVPFTASDVGAVPTSRKVNGKSLSSDITISASDIGATKFPDYSRLLKHVGNTIETWTATEDCYIISLLIGNYNFDLYINGYQVRYLDNYNGYCVSSFNGYAKKGDVIQGKYWKAYGLR